MAVYNREQTPFGTGNLRDGLSLKEQHLYGSSRLGIRTKENSLKISEFSLPEALNLLGEYEFSDTGNNTFTADYNGSRASRPLGEKQYEFSNHLGNVLATTSDRKLAEASNTNRMVIKPDGKVGIGTNTPDPDVLLEVNGGIKYSGTLDGTSDKRLKTNIHGFDYGLEEVLRLSPIFYNFNGKAGTDASRTHVGIYAQDLQKVAPELVKEFTYQEVEYKDVEDEEGVIDIEESKKGGPETYLSINDSAIKYMLINAIQEQQEELDKKDEQIEALQEEMKALKDLVQTALSNNSVTPSASQTVQLGTGSQLFQNQPNPFTKNTIIKYKLARGAKNAVLQITDINGSIIRKVTLSDAPEGQVVIEAQELSAGIYVYSLVIDGTIVSTKKMVLTE